MYYLYIIYSVSSDVYYVGYSDNPERRLAEHNSKPFSTFTSKHRPWVLNAVFKCGESESTSIRIERFIKKQKSRNLLEKLCDPTFVPSGFLAQLVIPHEAGRMSGINQRVVGSSPTEGAKP
jgi:putative endonuclease